MRATLRRYLVGAAATGPLRGILRSLVRDKGIVFMFHRFQDRELGAEGHSPEEVEETIRALRKMGLQIVPLLELIERATAGKSAGGMVALTVDDGYLDFHTVAVPLFEALDCPVTLFVATGFLDGLEWMWWDRLRFITEHTDRPTLSLDLAGATVSGSLEDPVSRRHLRSKMGDLLRLMRPSEREFVLQRTAEVLTVAVPERPPPACAPMSWDQIRKNETRGVTYGPHTITHPAMGTLELEEARREITGSWDRLRAETRASIPVFCFPYGVGGTLPSEPSSVLSECGMIAALTAHPGYLDSAACRESPFRLPRFPWPDDPAEVIAVGSGLTRAMEPLHRLRGEHPPPWSNSRPIT